MNTYSRIRLAVLFCLLGSSLLANNPFYGKVTGLLTAKKYPQLDALYEQVNKGPFVAWKSSDLELFFWAMVLDQKAPEKQWQARLDQLQTWRDQDPQSIAAVLALSDYYANYGFKARGTGWAQNVSPAQWALFYERRKKAETILDDTSSSAGQTLYGHYLRAWINAPDRGTFAITQKEVFYLNEHAPHFSAPYSLMADYLLPRWSGEPGELAQYAAGAADRLRGDEGDMLYADMLTWVAYEEEEKFVPLHHPDVPRMIRGCEDLLREDKENLAYRRARYAYALGMVGDWPACRQQLILAGPVYENIEAWWNRRQSYLELLVNTGLYDEITAATHLEETGHLDKAEAAFLALDPDRTTNLWLGPFYLVNGNETQFEASAGAPDLKQMPEKTPPDTLYENIIIFGTLRDFKRGMPYALRYDAIRGWNATAKAFFYEKALYEGDKTAADKARQTIVAWKTNRKGYQVAQAMLADGANVSSFSSASLDWNDPYSRQGAIMMALRFYELGMPQNARDLLQAAIKTSNYQRDIQHMRSLLLHPPAPLTDKAGTKAEKTAGGA